MARIGFLTVEEYRNRFDSAAHRVCETPKHRGQAIKAVVVIALADDDDSTVFGACQECFGYMDNDLGPDADWHLAE